MVKGAIPVAVAALLISAPARSAEADVPFRIRLAVDLPVVALSGMVYWYTAFIDNYVRPTPCSPTCDPQTVNRFDRPVIGFDSPGARIASDVMVGVIPTVVGGLTLLNLISRDAEAVLTDTILIAEAVTVAGAVNHIVKTAVARPRPYMYRGDEQDDIRKKNGKDYRSFYSSHSSVAFSAAVAFAVIFAGRHPEGIWRYLVWSVAIAAAGTVAALRVAGGKHFYTDVITGAVAGTGFGILIPTLHRTTQSDVTATVTLSYGFAGVVGKF